MRASQQELFRNEKLLYTVFKDKNSNDHFIEVVCGSTGMYEVCVKLLEDEITKFYQNHSELDKLAIDICKDPKNFKNRSF